MTGHYTRKAVISMTNAARQSRRSTSSSSKTKRKRSSSSSSRRRKRELAHDSQISIGTIGTAMTNANDDRQSQPMLGRAADADAATSSGSKSTRSSRHLPDHSRTPSTSGKKRRKEQQQIGTGPGHTSNAAATGSPLRRAMTRSDGPSLSITSSGIRMPPPLPPPPPPPCGLPPGMTSRTSSSAYHVQVQQQHQHQHQRNAFNSNGNDNVRGGGSSSVSGQMMPECSQLTMSQFSSSQTGASGGGGMYDSQHSGSNSHGSNHYGITTTNTGGFHGHGPPQPASTSMHQQRIPPMQPSGVPIIDRYGTSSYPHQRHGPSTNASSQGPTTRMMQQQQKQQYGASDDASTVHGRSQALLHAPPRPQPNRPPQIMAPPQLHQPFGSSFGPAIVPRPQQTTAPPRPQVLSTPSRIVQSAKEALWTIFTPNRKPPSSTFRRGPIGNGRGGGGGGGVGGNDGNGGFDRTSGLVAHHPASSPMSSSVASSKFVRLQPGGSQFLPQGSAVRTQAAASGGWRRLINAFTPSRGSIGACVQQKQKVQQSQQQKQRKAQHQPEGRGSVSSASTAAMVSVDSVTVGDQGKDANETPKIKNKASSFAPSALAAATTTAAGGSDNMADITLLSSLEKTKQSIAKERTVMENKMKLFESKMKAREAALTIREKALDTRTQEYESRVSEFHLSVDNIRAQFRAAREAEEELLRASARDFLLKAKEDVQRDFVNDLRAKTDDEVLLLSPGSAVVAHDSAKRRKVEAPALGGSSSRPRTSLSKTRLATLFTNANANTENSVPLEGASAGSSSSDQKKKSSKKSGDKKSDSVVLAKSALSDSPAEQKQKQGSRQSKVRAQATSSTEANVEHLSKEAGISPHNTAATSTSRTLSISSRTKRHQEPWQKEEGTQSTTPAWAGESSKKRSKKAYGTRSTSRDGGNPPGAGKENNLTSSINSSLDGDKSQSFHQSLSQSAGYGRRRRKKSKKKQDLLVAGTFGEDGEFSFSK